MYIEVSVFYVIFCMGVKSSECLSSSSYLKNFECHFLFMPFFVINKIIRCMPKLSFHSPISYEYDSSFGSAFNSIRKINKTFYSNLLKLYSDISVNIHCKAF